MHPTDPTAPEPSTTAPSGGSGAPGVPGAPVILRCALPTPLPKTLDYLLPTTAMHCPLPRPGTRVRASIGKRVLTGVLVAVAKESEVDLQRLKPVEAILDDAPLYPTQLMKLLDWTANYYLHPPGETLILGLSPRERRGEPPAPTGSPGLALNQRGHGLPEGALKRAKKQAELLSLLQQRPHSFEELDALGISRAVARELLAKNLAERVDTQCASDWSASPCLEATSEQQTAISAINRSNGSFTPHLLDGVTGSGKTEVYLQCIAHTLAQGKQVLVLLPEIGLTPQMISRFEARFNAPIAVLHSGLSDGERDRHWARSRSGSAAIVLGTRSAVFAPLARLGLIIVDEEHDGSFRQQDGLRYSARDVAVKRAQLEHCPVVLGSATPSAESVANAVRSRYQWHHLTERAGGASNPEKRIIDVRGLALEAGLSPELQSEIASTLAQNEQVLLFINRRGFAPTLLCHDCGWTAECPNCDARMTLHRKPAALRCHHCDSRRSLPGSCPGCHSRRLVSTGVGSEQAEMSLQRLFPGTPVHRVDSDSMTGRRAMSEFHRQMHESNPCIIVGTQMLTKGHHFPRVTCVGVIDADSLLFSPDFRGEERLAQLLTQVGGRAGRAESPGRVIIQTHNPEHPLMTAVLSEPYRHTLQKILCDRESRQLPPFGAMAMIRCDSPSPGDGLGFLQQLAQAARPHSQNVSWIGPLPATMARRAGLYRAQLLLHAASRNQITGATRAVAEAAGSLKAPAGLRWFMEVDPSETA